MKEFLDTNADNTLRVLKRELGPVFNTLSEKVIANLVKAFGEEFEEFASNSHDWYTF